MLATQSSILNPQSLFCIMGPTASGKSSLALEIAQQLPCEIISVDSAQVYRGMDIGTAKPSKEIQQEIPHHLINIRDPRDAYSAADFQRDATDAIHDILSREKIPLLVGGTMLYFRALQQGLSDMPSADETTRQRISKEAEHMGWPAMHQKLVKIDPEAAQKIHENDGQRIQRALEIFELTGQPISKFQLQQAKPAFQFINLGLGFFDREILHKRIERRFDEMLAAGFIEEVETLFHRGDLNRDLPSIRSVGYRQVWSYLVGEISFEAMRDKAIVATRQLAKRQLTWLRSWPALERADNCGASLICEQIRKKYPTQKSDWADRV